jgi:ATP-dependent DNA helicase RecQ
MSVLREPLADFVPPGSRTWATQECNLEALIIITFPSIKHFRIKHTMTFDSAASPDTLLPRFGLAEFRPGQREVIESVFAGHDCMCIMPTGGGKSLCYQLPAVARPGITLVISPLIALMKDQVDSLTARGLKATFINSSLEINELRERLDGLRAGAYDLVYIAPERLRNKSFTDALSSVQVQLLAIDEAHCISEWGHDFRPDYARIGRFREQLGNPQTIALTATATPLVRNDVIAMLRLKEPQVFITGFGRPNLHFEVREVWGKQAKWEALLELITMIPGAGIIYAATRKRCEEVAETLQQEKFPRRVQVYHAGLEPNTRRLVQEQFMSGEIPIIVATNAFGMGIDKSDLRFVIHYDLPGSLEAYYQEAGRAGRDGGDSRCVLLFNERDRWIQEFFIDSAYPSREVIGKIYEFLRKLNEDPIQLTLQEIKEALSLEVSGEGVSAAEKILEKAGALARLDSRQNLASVNLSSDLPTLVELLPQEAKNQRKVLRSLEKIVGDTRHDYVFFPLSKLEAISELDMASIARALRELKKLSCFDYIPPFRGRALRVLNRDIPFSKLQIDFSELERRKAAEYEKLEHVVTYARSRRCRQVEILDYFGDARLEKCCACDSCGGLFRMCGQPIALATPTIASPKTTTTKPSDDSLTTKTLLVVRMALSGVARAEGKTGKGLVAKMLAGSDSKEIKKMRFHQLSTYGLLQAWLLKDVTEFIELLIRVHLIDQRAETQFRPLVSLSDWGRKVMKGEEAFDLVPHLEAKFKKLIKQLKLPSESSPTLPERLAPMALAPVQPVESGLVPPPHWEMRPAHYWTAKLQAHGYSSTEIAEIRRLSLTTVAEHLAAAEGVAVESAADVQENQSMESQATLEE